MEGKGKIKTSGHDIFAKWAPVIIHIAYYYWVHSSIMIRTETLE